MNICIFGDSIVWGYGDNRHGGWVALLRRALFYDGYIVYNCGVVGDYSGGLMQRIRHEARARRADVAIISIGHNDASYRAHSERPKTPKDTFITNIKTIIRQLEPITSHVVFCGLVRVDEERTMPYLWHRKPVFYENAHLGLYDRLLQDVCTQAALPFISVHDVLAPDDFADGIHPNPNGHEKLFTRIRPAIQSIVKNIDSRAHTPESR